MTRINKNLKPLHFLAAVVLLCCFLSSCKEEENIHSGSIKVVPMNKTFSKTHFDFPDSVNKGPVYKSKIYYSSAFDTLRLKLDWDRFINFIVRTDTKQLNYEEVLKMSHDTFLIENDTINFNVSFKNQGENYINGFISDKVYIETDSTIRIKETVVPMIYKVIVK